MAGRVIQPFFQFFDGAGDPLAYGWLRFLESGSNNTNKDTYNDENLNIANANPLRLDGEGRCPSVFGEGRYRIISLQNDPNDETVPGTMIQTFDPVTAQGETAAGSSGGTFDTWDNTKTYSVGDLVTHSSKYFRSIANFNINKNPSVEDGYWEELEFIVYWNENVDYDIGEMVRDSGNLYFSTIANNLNNIPGDSPVEWRSIDRVFLSVDEYTVNYSVQIADMDKLLILGSSAILGATFTLPAVTADHDGFIYNFYNASDFDLTLAPTVPSTLWLSNAIVLKKGSFLQLQYNNSYDKWLPIGNSGPSLGGQDIGTLSNPTLANYLNTVHFVGSFDIELATVPLWRFHTNGTLYPLVSNVLPDIGISANPINDIWQTGTHYYGDMENTVYGDASALTITAKTLLKLATIADPTKYVTLNATGLTVVSPVFFTGALTLSGNLIPGADNSYNIGISSTNEWNNIYVGNGGIYVRNGSTRLYHSGSHFFIDNGVGNTYFDNPTSGDWYFREGTTSRFLLTDTGILQIIGYGNTSSFHLSLGSAGQGKIYQDSSKLVLYTSGHLYFYTNNTARWYIDDTTGHLLPLNANSRNIGGVNNELLNIYMGSSGKFYIGNDQAWYWEEYGGEITEVVGAWTTIVNAGDDGYFISASVITANASDPSYVGRFTCGYFCIDTHNELLNGAPLSSIYARFDSGNYQIYQLLSERKTRLLRLKTPYVGY